MTIKNTNSRIGTLTNLPTGATYDLLMISYPDGFPEGQIQFDIEDTSRKVTGIQKVGQLFMKVLLTTKGSDVIHPTQGTIFPTLAINANLTSNLTVLQSEIVTAVTDAANQVRAALVTSTDPASRLARAQIAAMDTTRESIVLYVQIVTDAGETAQVSVPFPEAGLT